MALYNYIKKISLDDIVFTQFDHNLDFVANGILPDVIAHSRNHKNYNPCRMNFIYDRIAYGLMEQ